MQGLAFSAQTVFLVSGKKFLCCNVRFQLRCKELRLGPKPSLFLEKNSYVTTQVSTEMEGLAFVLFASFRMKSFSGEHAGLLVFTALMTSLLALMAGAFRHK